MSTFYRSRLFQKFWQIAAIGYLMAIFVLSSIPGLTPPPLGFAWQDKFYHFLEYAILSVILFTAFRSTARKMWRKNAHWLTVLVALFYAATDEIHQTFVRNRNGDFWDWVADGVGIIAVQILIFLGRLVLSKIKLTSPYPFPKRRGSG